MTKKIIRNASLLTIIGIAVILCGCNSYVGVEWVTDYTQVGKPNVPNRDDCAEGFYDIISVYPGWVGDFNVGNADAWEKHFKRESMGGIDDLWVDSVHFVYFAGHGAGSTNLGLGSAFTFGVDANDDWILSAIPSNREPRWGDGLLNFIVLDVCSALALKEDGAAYEITQRWANSDVMHGLHYILGFRTSAFDQANRGCIFAEYLTGARGDGSEYTIRCAWMQATIETEMYSHQGAFLMAHDMPDCTDFAASDIFYDTISNWGEDPDPSRQHYLLCYWDIP